MTPTHVSGSSRTHYLPRLALVLLVLALLTGGLQAQTVAALDSGPQVEVDLAPVKDNTLYQSDTGALSNGQGSYLFVGATAEGSIRRAVLAFDIAGNIPAGAAITSVTLRLHMSRSIAGASPISLHRITTDWGEGASNASGNEGGGAAAAPGDATWVHTFFDTATWNMAGGDFIEAASAVQSVGGVGVYQWSSDQMVADVRTWLNQPGANFGWLLKGDESVDGAAKRFDSRENLTIANRPLLHIEYTLPVVPHRLWLPLIVQ